MRKNNIIRISLATAFILLLPLVAMQFSDEINWSPGDFAVAGVLLFGTGLAYELATRLRADTAYRVAIGLALAAALILVWINLAVGLIGSEDNPANVLYIGVLTSGAVGAAIARLRPIGMARTLFAMAFAQALVPVIAMIVWKPQISTLVEAEVLDVLAVLLLNALIVVLFTGSALLFLRAGSAASEMD